MSDNIKSLTNEEVEQIENLIKNFQIKTNEIGQAEISIEMLKLEKARMLEEYNKLLDEEKNIYTQLEEKYGKGQIDLNNKQYHTL